VRQLERERRGDFPRAVAAAVVRDRDPEAERERRREVCVQPANALLEDLRFVQNGNDDLDRNRSRLRCAHTLGNCHVTMVDPAPKRKLRGS
jgi:hypothetical protein